ncbi:hypothetical protein [Methylobacterium nodulans]|uniref:Uncharacterized protein n=1 Tax=Methylobacterium nodulans (strain LMG 21967 / CNCM I-2342 / ORS 2060) TaxID=460265 RepID=B8ICY2_METNO|nr:hypothetical protein [Methylobacterium nodulans]ACL59374.1 hypothetical protein Mnod_4506 [Methylobacterium nodulans ORS 2060]
MPFGQARPGELRDFKHRAHVVAIFRVRTDAQAAIWFPAAGIFLQGDAGRRLEAGRRQDRQLPLARAML